MSNRALTWAFSQRLGGRASEKLVLLDLADHADDNHRAWPRVAYIAERTELSEATVLRAIKQLIEWGLVEKLKRRTQIGRPRANLYTLRLDREAPLELAEPTVMVTVGVEEDSENADEIEVSGAAPVADSHPADSHGDSHMTCTTTVTNRTLTSEPSITSAAKTKPAAPVQRQQPESSTPAPAERPPTSPAAPVRGPLPAAPSGDAAGLPRKANADSGEAVRDRYERATTAWQRHNVYFAIGDETANWKAFRKLTADDQLGLLASIDNFLTGKKAEYARWKNAPKAERATRKPKIPPLRDVCAFELWRLAGTPSEPGPAAKILEQHVELCRSIAGRAAANAIWVEAGTDAWRAWTAFFRLHGQRLGVRRATISDQMEVKARAGSEGWRFPSQFPPKETDHGQEKAA
jgi:DNA-binding MarR family transcriptional regulator